MSFLRGYGPHKQVVLGVILLVVVGAVGYPVLLWWYENRPPPKADPGPDGFGTEESARAWALYKAKSSTTGGTPFDEVEIDVTRNEHGWWFAEGERLHHTDDGLAIVPQSIRFVFYYRTVYGRYSMASQRHAPRGFLSELHDYDHPLPPSRLRARAPLGGARGGRP